MLYSYKKIQDKEKTGLNLHVRCITNMNGRKEQDRLLIFFTFMILYLKMSIYMFGFIHLYTINDSCLSNFILSVNLERNLQNCDDPDQ